MRSFFFSILILTAATAFAAPMMRVTGVKDARTLIVDRGGVASEVKLGDVIIPPGDEAAAVDFLRTKVVERYVMVESNARGEAYVYRSPDALFINGELLRRAYLTEGTKMTIIGESFPGPERSTRAAPAPAVKRIPALPRPRTIRRASKK
jgi:hypothetical protein